MATGYILLFPGGYGGDGTANSVSAAPDLQVSSTAASSNMPKLFRPRLAFDKDTDEHWFFSFKMPGDYASGGTIRGSFATTATTGKVVWMAGQGVSSAANDNDQYANADTTSGANGTSVSGTANTEVEFTITLTTTGLAANATTAIFIKRDADDVTNDTCAADALLYSLTFEYTTT